MTETADPPNFRPEDFRLASQWAYLAIKGMPASQVPHSLAKIRGSSDRRLTPPNERTIYRELNKNEQFRQATLEVLDAAASEEPLPRDRDSSLAEAAMLFLARPEGWEERAGRLLVEESLEGASKQMATLERELGKTRAEVGKLKKQSKEARRAAAAQSRRATSQLNEDLGRARKRIRDLQGELSRQCQENHRLDRELEASFDELTEADRRYDELRRRYSLKAKTFTAPTGGSGRGEVVFSRDPLEAARMLDQIVSYWEVGPDSRPDQDGPDRRRMELPIGMDPKSADAVRWIFFEAPRLNLIVDGWNVAHYWHYHQQNPDKPDSRTKEFITNKLENLVKYSVGRHQASFYLDSRLEVGLEADWASKFKSRRLTGYYVENADDAIAEEAATRAGEPVVVITSDNGLAQRCQVHGAVRVYSEALAEWMSDSPV